MAGRLSALTTRGRAFLAAGLAAGMCAVVLGQQDLLRVAIFLAALPLITVLVVSRTRYRISAVRLIQHARVPIGQSCDVRLRLENTGRMPTALLLLEDTVPYALGTRPRFVLDRMSARWHREVGYTLRSDVRGRFTIGPLTVRATDPFGLVEVTRSFETKDALLVTPAVHALPHARLGGEWATSGDSRPRAHASHGEEDVTVREYRDGDDLRRVHWRSSARRGELMVRREEQPWQSRATIFLDTRRIGHRGTGPASSFEWAVTAAASIGTHLLQRGYSVRLLTDTGSYVDAASRDSPHSDVESSLLAALAVIDLSSAARLDHGSTASNGRPGSGGTGLDGSGLLVALVGSLTPADSESMVRLRQGVRSAFAILLDAPTWAMSKERAPDQQTERLQDGQRALERGGWRVGAAAAGEPVGEVWARLVLSQGPAPEQVPVVAGRNDG